jgi:hypothetical protein
MNDGGPGGSTSWKEYGQIALRMFDLFNEEMDIILPSHR